MRGNYAIIGGVFIKGENTMADLCEALMILCFGLSWPTSVHKSYVSRTAKGKSITFELFILVGYVFGNIRKVIQLIGYQATGTKAGFLFWFAWFFYIFNIACIIVDLVLYARNVKLDREADAR